MLYHILAVGDVVGEPGLRHLERVLRPLQKLKNISFTVVNGENASGVGLTRDQAERIRDAGPMPSPWGTTPSARPRSGTCWRTRPGSSGPPTTPAGPRATAAGCSTWGASASG